MPENGLVEHAESSAAIGAEVMEVLDIGILVLNASLRPCFVNASFLRLSGLVVTRETRLSALAAFLTDRQPAAEVAGTDVQWLRELGVRIRRGLMRRAIMPVREGGKVLFQCEDLPSGGYVITLLDITAAVRQEVERAIAESDAERRFVSETLESQASYLASMAETADGNARAAEAARARLEQEIKERRQLEAKLRRMATTDSLTGAANRAQLMAAGQTALESHLRSGSPMAVLMLDVDHFKSVNDRYGHAAGDHALQHLVRLLRKELRQHDLLARMGGEEFAVVLLGTPASAAGTVAERLRLRIAQTPFRVGNREITLTVSTGLTMVAPDDRSMEQVLRRADKALYHAKHLGRNRVEAA